MFTDVRVQSALIATAAGIIGGVAGTYVKHYFDKRLLRHKLETEYEYEERKKFRALIGRYHGRILLAAEYLDHRLWNLQANEFKGWLHVDCAYRELGNGYYYFKTTAYRFVDLLTLIRLFQKEALYIDSRIAKGNELAFLKFAKSLEWVMTDVSLFEGLNYDVDKQHDHFFVDNLRIICDRCTSGDDVVELTQFQSHIGSSADDDQILQLLDFFNGLCKDEDRLRWDRVIAFHLLLMAFIYTFGYDMQRATPRQFIEIAESVQHQKVLHNLNTWLRKLGLADEKAAKLISAAVSPTPMIA